ncbi:MAG: BolA family transcriptional regulator [Armatimonadetes bacterium]|nr:BolA family transcriptional regulator [Armatimonadota bacterium]
MDVKQIEKLIKAALPDAEVRVEDPMNDRTHFEALVISPSFQGKNRVQQHQMVYRALGGAFEGPLHALSLKTMTPEQAGL